MLEEHETKHEEMFTKHEKSVLVLISGDQSFLKQRPDQLCNSLTSVKTDVEEHKESLSFTQNNIEERFWNIYQKVQSLEKELISKKEGVGVIQTIKQTWALKVHRKLMDLEDRSRKNSLRILNAKEDPRETWEECENKIYNM